MTSLDTWSPEKYLKRFRDWKSPLINTFGLPRAKSSVVSIGKRSKLRGWSYQQVSHAKMLEDEQASAHRLIFAIKMSVSKTGYIKRIKLFLSLSFNNCIRSVLTTSVKILPYRPPARFIRANYCLFDVFGVLSELVFSGLLQFRGNFELKIYRDWTPLIEVFKVEKKIERQSWENGSTLFLSAILLRLRDLWLSNGDLALPWILHE